MRINLQKALTGLASLIIILTVSCRKEDQAPAKPSELLVGYWQQYGGAVDGNRNGIADTSERFTPDSNTAIAYNFKADKTVGYQYRLRSQPAPMNWELLNNDEDLRVWGSLGGATVDWTMHVVKLNRNELTLIDTSFDGYLYHLDFRKL